MPAYERERREALRALEMLDTPAEAGFDALTTLAAHILGVPIALVSLLDTDRQHQDARHYTVAAEAGEMQ